MSFAPRAVIRCLPAVASIPGTLSVASVTPVDENVDTVGYLDWKIFQGAVDGSWDNSKLGAGLIVGPTLTNMTRAAGPGGIPVTESWTQGGGGSTTQGGEWIATSTAAAAYIDFTVPAGIGIKKARIFVGTYVVDALVGRAQAVRFTLSDASASEVVLTPTQTTDYQRRFTLFEATYNAASAGQTLRIRFENPAPTATPENHISLVTYI